MSQDNQGYYVEPIILNTDDMEPPQLGSGLRENRKNIYAGCLPPGAPKCSIMVQGYNRLDKTKYCVECILEHTADIDYELLLVDNGSSDGTCEFYQTVPYKNKRIIKVTKNLSTGYPQSFVRQIFKGRYLVIVSNDVYVTKNWLSNLLTCLESDPDIGFVVPVSSNVSNLQQVDLGYQTLEEMQEMAAQFNKSDPAKWEERLRLITITMIFSRELLDNVGVFDSGFVHDFSEDDLAMRVRRAGYKMVLCGDTFVCHDHDFRNLEDKDPQAFLQSLDSGRVLYKEKYYGIDAWDDVLNFELKHLSFLDRVPLPTSDVRALSLEARCGTPVLEIRNRLRRRGITDVVSYAFTTDAKYYLDLRTVAAEVKCDRLDFVQEAYANGFFDIVHLGEPVNMYNNPLTLVRRLYDFLKPGGILLFKLRNANTLSGLRQSLGLGGLPDFNRLEFLSPEALNASLKQWEAGSIEIDWEFDGLAQSDRQLIEDIVKRLKGEAAPPDVLRLMIRDYLYCVRK